MDNDDESFYDAEDAFFDADGGDTQEPSSPVEMAVPPATPGEETTAATKAGAVDSEADATVSAAPPDMPQEPFPLHRAAWSGQLDLVQRLAAGMSKEEIRVFDSQGNTALHVAVMRRRADVVAALLAAGSPAGLRNQRGWVPLMEAVEVGDRPLALQVAEAEVAQMKVVVKAKKAAVLALLRTELPDFSLQLKWELGSSMPGVGALVRRYAPHDTYTLWKKGGRIRVDGTLMGVDEDSATVVPTWKRGHFSLLYDASGEKARALIVNHVDKTYLDVKAARKKLGVDADSASNALSMEVDVLMASEVLQHKKLRSVDFRFKPVTGWLTKEVREKVEGWNCKLYEAAGRLIAMSRYKMPYGLPSDMSYDDYLAATFDADPVVESPVNPMNPSSLKDRGMNPAKAAAKLAVAAKHQRVAAAAAAAKNDDAARVATAAAARAAAGGMRALAPRVDDDDDDDNDDDGARKAGGEGLTGLKGADSTVGREDSATLHRTPTGKSKDFKEGVCAMARVDAVSEPGPAAAGGTGASGVDGVAALDLDLTALAAKVAAEAATAAAQRADGEDEDDDEGQQAGPHSRADREGTGSKRGSGKAGPSTAATATAAAAGPRNGKGGGSAAASSAKGWRSLSAFGLGKKASEPVPGDGDAAGAAAGGSGSGPGAGAGGSQVAKKSRKISGRCWMAESFPLSLKQLLPLLEVVGTANKAFAKVARFMNKYGNLDMFPVKIQVPLMLTVYMLLSFKQFKLMDKAATPDDSFFEVPAGYTEGKIEKPGFVGVASGEAKDGAGGSGAAGAAEASGSKKSKRRDGDDDSGSQLTRLQGGSIVDDDLDLRGGVGALGIDD